MGSEGQLEESHPNKLIVSSYDGEELQLVFEHIFSSYLYEIHGHYGEHHPDWGQCEEFFVVTTVESNINKISATNGPVELRLTKYLLQQVKKNVTQSELIGVPFHPA